MLSVFKLERLRLRNVFSNPPQCSLWVWLWTLVQLFYSTGACGSYFRLCRVYFSPLAAPTVSRQIKLWCNAAICTDCTHSRYICSNITACILFGIVVEQKFHKGAVLSSQFISRWSKKITNSNSADIFRDTNNESRRRWSVQTLTTLWHVGEELFPLTLFCCRSIAVFSLWLYVSYTAHHCSSQFTLLLRSLKLLEDLPKLTQTRKESLCVCVHHKLHFEL